LLFLQATSKNKTSFI